MSSWNSLKVKWSKYSYVIKSSYFFYNFYFWKKSFSLSSFPIIFLSFLLRPPLLLFSNPDSARTQNPGSKLEARFGFSAPTRVRVRAPNPRFEFETWTQIWVQALNQVRFDAPTRTRRRWGRRKKMMEEEEEDNGEEEEEKEKRKKMGEEERENKKK